MKKIVSSLLAVMLITSQSIHTQSTIYTQGESSMTDTVYNGISYGVSCLGQGAWKVTKGICSVTGKVAARAASDIAKSQTAQTGFFIGAAAATAYGTYWLSTAKTRQDLKSLKNSLAPEIPTVETGINKKAKYRIFNWELNGYPTAGKLKQIRSDANKMKAFLNALAADIINNEFKDIDSALCTNAAGHPVSNMRGIQLTQEAATQILLRIPHEKEMLGKILEALQGKMSIAASNQNGTNHYTVNQ